MRSFKRIFGASVPKSGTHLLELTFRRLGYRTVACRKELDSAGRRVDRLPEAAKINDGDVYAYGHWRYHQPYISYMRDFDFRVIVLIRDPRDICLSYADHLEKELLEETHDPDPSLLHCSRKELVKKTIEGFKSELITILPVTKVCSGWLDWQQAGGVLLRYEEIVKQIAEQQPIKQVGQVGLDPEEFLRMATRSFGDKLSVTMNKGQTRRWTSEFDDELRECWRLNARGLATLFGFEEI